MRIVEVWTLKEGILDPPRPLEPEQSRWVEDLWWRQDMETKPAVPSGPFSRMTERELLHLRVIDNV